MSNPLRLFGSLKDMYLRYLDSPFDLRYQDLVAERRQILDRDGRIYRYPMIEPVPVYSSSGQTFQQMVQSLLGTRWPQPEVDDLAEFVSRGLFDPNLYLYTHQWEAFEESVLNGNDVVITTGTGSGKTECFLLPIIASILRESAGWGTPSARNPEWDWWEHYTMQGSRRRFARRWRLR